MNMWQVIQGGYRGMPDSQLDNERGAQKRLQAAIIELSEAIAMVNHESSIIKISVPEWECFVQDSLPDFGQWEEKIAAERLG